jgi:hypothetical protein
MFCKILSFVCLCTFLFSCGVSSVDAGLSASLDKGEIKGEIEGAIEGDLSFESMTSFIGRAFADDDSRKNSYRLMDTKSDLETLENSVPCGREYSTEKSRWVRVPNIVQFAEFDLKEKNLDEQYIFKDIKSKLSSSEIQDKFGSKTLWEYLVDKGYMDGRGRIFVGDDNKISLASFEAELKSNLKYLDSSGGGVAGKESYNSIIDGIVDYFKLVVENNLNKAIEQNPNLDPNYDEAYGSLLLIKCIFMAEHGSESMRDNARFIDEYIDSGDYVTLEAGQSIESVDVPDGKMFIYTESIGDESYALAYCGRCNASRDSYFSLYFYFKKNPSTNGIDIFFERIAVDRRKADAKTMDNNRIRLFVSVLPKDSVVFKDKSISNIISNAFSQTEDEASSDLNFELKVKERKGVVAMLWGDGSECIDCRGVVSYKISQQTRDDNMQVLSKLGAYKQYKKTDTIRHSYPQEEKEQLIPSDDIINTDRLLINNNNFCFLIPANIGGDNLDVAQVKNWDKFFRAKFKTQADQVGNDEFVKQNIMEDFKELLTTGGLAACGDKNEVDWR